MAKIQLGVIFGSRSCEHEVSIISGVQLARAADRGKYDVWPIYIAKDGRWYTGEKLLDIGRKSEGAVFHESPQRVKALVKAIGDTLPGARLSVSCDLTKLHELTLRGAPEEILSALEGNEKSEKGEYCLVADLRGVHLPEEAPAPQASLEARLFERLLDGESLRSATEALAAQGEKKNAVKAAALRIKQFLDEA